jgi:hypothetical protein
MSEEKNIEQGNESVSGDASAEINKSDLPALPTGQAGGKAGIITPDIPNMEVHHHPETEKKNFKEYLLEGLMIFLAVTMGFFAENIREHFVEGEREKQYLQSLYVDLKADTAFINVFNLYGITWEDSVLEKQMDLINSGRYATESKSFYQSASAATGALYFQYNNSTYEQLKSSGNLRLLSNHELAKSLTEYDNFIHEVVKKFESRYLETNTRLTAYQWQVLDVSFFKNNPEGSDGSNAWIVNGSPTFKGEDIPKLKMLNSLYFEKRSMYPSYRNMMDSAKSKAARLIETIRKDDHSE